jgi:hypothetical protein
LDPIERLNKAYPAYATMLDSLQARIWTAMPGIVDSWNTTDNTVEAHIAIKGTLQGPDGTLSFVPYPPLHKLPVHFPGGGNVLCSFPIAAGDEIIIMFVARALDTWWQSGGVQQPLERRFHELSDCFCIPCVWSVPNIPTNLSTTTAQLRSKDGGTYVELDAANNKVNVVAPSDLTVTAPHAVINGDLRVTGKVISLYGTGNDVELDTHKHTDVQSGGNQTGGPVKPS